MTLRLAWFATAKGTSSRLLFERAAQAIADGQLDARIVVAFCNRERGQSANTDAYLDTVERAGVPLATLSSSAWRERVGGAVRRAGDSIPQWRHDFDAAVYERIAAYGPDSAVLAGYMLVATEELCDRLPLLNLHPAEPGGPVGTWREVIGQLIEGSAATSGMMIQRATMALDRGPIVTSCRYSIRGSGLDALWAGRSGAVTEDEPLFGAIRELGVRREPAFLIASLQAVADGRAALPPAEEPGPQIDLSAEVEAAIRRDGS